MPTSAWVLVAMLGLLAGCDETDAKPDDAAPADEAKPEQAKSADETKAKAERKVHHLPPEEVDGKQPEPEGKPKAETRPLDPKPSASSKLLTLEDRSPAVKGGMLVENVGVAAMAGRFAPNLAAGCEAPCWQPAPMWPKQPTESTIEFEVFRGKTLLTKDAKRLGKFRVTGVPTGARTEVVVGFGVQDGAIKAHAKVRSTDAELTLEPVD